MKIFFFRRKFRIVCISFDRKKYEHFRFFSRTFSSICFAKKMRNVREIEKKIFRKKDEKNHAKISRKKCWNYAKQHKNFAKKYGWFKIFFLEFAGSWLAGFGWTYVDGQKLRKIAREIKFSSSNIYKS